jgi:hypothetical protein
MPTPSTPPPTVPPTREDAATTRPDELDPMKAGRNEMVRALALDWRNGRSTRAEFINGCRNMGIFNPELKP